jgi:tRNA threonylcarbamoyladenosine modification (KEOPS) complex  Pcc1 subunit
MEIVCTLELEFPDPETADKIAKALELENEGYIAAAVKGNTIVVTAKSDSVMALKNTVDDFLACATVAQKALEGSE